MGFARVGMIPSESTDWYGLVRDGFDHGLIPNPPAEKLQFFNLGIEVAALHCETMGLPLIARELRDQKRFESESQT